MNTSTNRNILVYTNYLTDFNFFSKFKTALKLKNYNLIFVTNKLSLGLYAKIKQIEIHLISKVKPTVKEKEIENSFDVLSKNLTLNEASDLYTSVNLACNEIVSTRNIYAIFLLNGENVHDKALKKIAEENNIPILFFELANIPGKIFVDKKGVNAGSSLFFNINILERFNNSTDEDFEKWREQYIEIKKNQKTIPQATKSKKIRNILFPLDKMGYLFFNIPYNKKGSFLKKVKLKLKDSVKELSFDYYNIYKHDYIFYPMQVESDSQLIIHSKYKNIDAIKYAMKIAKENNLQLLIKPHPAETDFEVYKKILLLKEKMNFYIINKNVFELLINCRSVITINSTVGLEAMILGKKVHFLGDSFYKYLDQSKLKSYIMSYLINIDFFSKNPVSINEIESILLRLDE